MSLPKAAEKRRLGAEDRQQAVAAHGAPAGPATTRRRTESAAQEFPGLFALPISPNLWRNLEMGN
jgi:hypothetical protein